MERSEIIKNINSCLAEEFEKNETTFSADGNLYDVLEIDSLDLVDIIVLIEKKFGIKTAKEDFADVKTFNNLYDFLENRINK